MKKSFYLGATVLITLLLSACVNKINIENDPTQGTVPISFSTKVIQQTTRVTDTSFEEGDEVGLYAMITPITLTGKHYIDNLKLQCTSGSKLSPAKTVFYPEDNTTLDFISYYPFQPSGIAAGESTFTISTMVDQSTKKDYSLSDFMLAKKEHVQSSDKAVELSFEHQLAKLKIVLVPSPDEDVQKILAANPHVILTGIFTKGTYNLQNGTISNLEQAEDVTPYGSWKNQNDSLKGKSMILIPQKLDKDITAFILEWNGRFYTCQMPSLDLAGGMQYEICITAKEANPPVFSGIISKVEDWQTAEGCESKNQNGVTSIHLAMLSFGESDVYRIYHQGFPIAEVCKEYLESPTLHSPAIVAYPINNEEKADLSKGVVMQLADTTSVSVGGIISWNTSKNSFTYTPGNMQKINSFYIDEAGAIAVEKPQNPQHVSLLSYRLTDIRKGVVKSYPIVKIGVQYWMKENLCAASYRDGTDIPAQTELNGTPGYFQPKNSEHYFYNGEALRSDLAPEEWRIPSTKDWEKLQSYVSDNASLVKSGKWRDGKNGTQPVNNLTDFNAAPIGVWMSKEVNHAEESVGFWTMDNGTIPELTAFFNNDTNTFVFYSTISSLGKFYKGISVRCVKE
jgi:uncharacterized protein (TIGR02145 family)